MDLHHRPRITLRTPPASCSPDCIDQRITAILGSCLSVFDSVGVLFLLSADRNHVINLML